MSELQGLRKQLSVRPEEAEEEQLLQVITTWARAYKGVNIMCCPRLLQNT